MRLFPRTKSCIREEPSVCVLFKLNLTLVWLMLNIRRLPFSVGLKLMRLKRCLRCYMFVHKQANIVFANIVLYFLKEYSYFCRPIFSRNIYKTFIILHYKNWMLFSCKNEGAWKIQCSFRKDFNPLSLQTWWIDCDRTWTNFLSTLRTGHHLQYCHSFQLVTVCSFFWGVYVDKFLTCVTC